MKKYIPGETKEQRKARKNLAKSSKLSKNIPPPETISTVPTNNKIAFVIGNGTSREPIALPSLKPFGKIYGCNALYRDFIPDYLVAVDTKMVLELNKVGIQHQVETWTNPNRAYAEMTGFKFFQPSKGWSSGPTALWLAAEHEYEDIYILGFDYAGLENNSKLNNLYADTKNYKRSNEGATFYGNWLRQTKTVIRDNKNINFHRVIAPDNYKPDELNTFDNFRTIELEEFQQIFGFSQI